MRILVTDGVYKNTLAILRTLGRKHCIDITSSFPKIATLSSYSKYSRNTYVLKHSLSGLESYAEELLTILHKGKYDLLLPVGLRSYLAVSKHREAFQSLTKIIVADWDKMQIASSRYKTMELAHQVGIPTPEIQLLHDDKHLAKIAIYPVVLKSSGNMGGYVKYCNNREELEQRITGFKK